MLARLAMAALCLLAAPLAAHAQTARAPASAYGRLPEVDQAEISPDGTKLALLRTYQDQMAVQIVDAKTLAHISIKAPEPSLKFRSVHWSLDGQHVIIAVSATSNPYDSKQPVIGSNIGSRDRDARGAIEYWRLAAAPIVGPAVALYNYNEMSRYVASLTEWWHAPPAEKSAIRMMGLKPGAGYLVWAIQRVNLDDGSGSTAAEGTTETVGYIANGRGETLGRVDYRAQGNQWALFARKGAGWREVMRETNETGSPPIASHTFTDGKFAMFDNRNTPRDEIYAIDQNTGAISMVYSDAKYDVGGYEIDPWSQEIVGAYVTKDFGTQTFFDPKLEAVRLAVNEAFKDGHATLTSWNLARDTFTVRGFHGAEPASYYLYHTGDNSLTRIAQSYPELASAPLGRRLSLNYKARDGLTIPAYLTLPETGPQKGLPLVLLVHGGPHARDTASFDWLASFLASRGYAVLQPNFRGSSGYGEAFEYAGRGEWGGLMQTDLNDGVAALARSGMIDPKRVCIVGASYGGYAALAGVSLNPELYVCAISIGGIANMDLFVDRMEERTSQQGATRDFYRLTLGAAYSDAVKRHSISPIDNAQNIRAPILLIHGALDSVVSADQSTRFRDRLVALKKPVEYVQLNGDDHWLSYAPTRIKTLEAMETFLARNLPVN